MWIFRGVFGHCHKNYQYQYQLVRAWTVYNIDSDTSCGNDKDCENNQVP